MYAIIDAHRTSPTNWLGFIILILFAIALLYFAIKSLRKK